MFPNLKDLVEVLRQADAAGESVRRHQPQLDELAKMSRLDEAVLHDEASRISSAAAFVQAELKLASSRLAVTAARLIEPPAWQSIKTAAQILADREVLLTASIQTAAQSVRLPAWHSIQNMLGDVDAARLQMDSAFASLVAPRQMEHLVQRFASAARFIEERAYWEERHQDRRLADLLAPRGWLGIERHLNVRDTNGLLRIRGANRGRAIDRKICSLFRSQRHARISAMAKAWGRVPYLQERKSIVRQALGAHKERKWALSINALLPLADGLAAEIRKHNPTRTVVTSKGKPRLIAVEDVVALYDPAGRSPAWGALVVATVCQLMFKSYDFEKEKSPTPLNRHGVLHGRVAKYATEVNSLKTILLVDVMAHIATRVGRKAA